MLMDGSRWYVIGSLRNPEIVRLAERMRMRGAEVHDDWYAPGPKTDEHWREYEQARGHDFVDALQGRHAQNVFEYDRDWLHWADAVVMLMPAGKSGHIELGYAAGIGKETHIILAPEQDRWDVMYKFADYVWRDVEEFLEEYSD